MDVGEAWGAEEGMVRLVGAHLRAGGGRTSPPPCRRHGGRSACALRQVGAEAGMPWLTLGRWPRKMRAPCGCLDRGTAAMER